MNTYTSRNDAIQYEIIDAIDAGAADASEYDVEAIADAVLGDYSQGFAVIVDTDDFWAAVAANEA